MASHVRDYIHVFVLIVVGKAWLSSSGTTTHGSIVSTGTAYPLCLISQLHIVGVNADFCEVANAFLTVALVTTTTTEWEPHPQWLRALLLLGYPPCDSRGRKSRQ